MAPMKRLSPSHVKDVDETLSLESVARRLHITRKKTRELLGKGQLDFVQIRGHFRIPRASLERYIAEQG